MEEKALWGWIDSQKESPQKIWAEVSKNRLTRQDPFALHLKAFEHVYRPWSEEKQGARPAVFPQGAVPRQVARLFQFSKTRSFPELHAWTLKHRETYWQHVARDFLRIRFQRDFTCVFRDETDALTPEYFPGARLNIAESCLRNHPPDALALIEEREDGRRRQLSYRELDEQSARLAGALRQKLRLGDAVGLALPMNLEAVVIYFALVRAGLPVIGIADSFSAEEIRTRLRLGQAQLLFTQDFSLRNGKRLPLLEKCREASPALPKIVVAADEKARLLPEEQAYEKFSGPAFGFAECEASATMNILFSSGTTGDPKAIPWTHTTPIKCAADALFHQGVEAGDRLAWPTSLGWMMGPWLLYAALLNGATVLLYDGAPQSEGFVRFVAENRTTLLGVVPSLVKAWRTSGLLEKYDWSGLRAFSSTGECSNFEDMLYLMSRTNYRPIIEYCGGTEIGGSYLSSSLVQPNAPGAFSTPVLGLGIHLRDETSGAPTERQGEVWLEGPSVGLSTRLLNRDHYETYFGASAPKLKNGQPLRRHGDEVERLGPESFRAQGRVDDTMNLGGIKVSSAEIERALAGLPGLVECAAVAVPPPGGGPSLLILFAVSEKPAAELLQPAQKALSEKLNPLFRIAEIKVLKQLPRTASNKILRRNLRDDYLKARY